MKMSMRPVAVFFLVFLLVLTTEDAGPRKAEAGIFSRRKCKTPSKKFKGICTRDSNCDTACRYEGYPAGDCKGIRRRCLCCTHT